MEILSSSDCSQRFFFLIIDFVVEDPKIDPIPFFVSRIVVGELRGVGETFSLLRAAVRGLFFFWTNRCCCRKLKN